MVVVFSALPGKVKQTLTAVGLEAVVAKVLVHLLVLGMLVVDGAFFEICGPIVDGYAFVLKGDHVFIRVMV